MVRTALARLLVVAVVLLVVIADAGIWLSRAVVDRAAFEGTAAAALERPDVAAPLAQAVARAVVDDIATSPPIVLGALRTQILGLSADAPEADVRSALADRVRIAFADARVRAAGDALIDDIHGAFVNDHPVMTGTVSVVGDQLVVDPSRLVTALADATDPRVAPLVGGRGLLASPIRLVSVAGRDTIQRQLSWTTAMAPTALLLAILAGLLTVVLAHRRPRAMAIVGVAIGTGALLTAALGWAIGPLVAVVSPDAAAAAVGTAVAAGLVEPLGRQSAVIAVVGLALVPVAGVSAWSNERRTRRSEVERLFGPR